MIGRIITADIAPKGMMKSGKAGASTEYTPLFVQIAGLAVGTGIELTQDEIEYSRGVKAVFHDGKENLVAGNSEQYKRNLELVKKGELKLIVDAKPAAMPKFFVTNLKRKVNEKFGEGNVSVTKYDSGKGTRCVIHVIKLAEAPAPEQPAA